MTRTPAEIIARVEAVTADDFFGVMRSELIGALPFDAARAYLKPEVTADEWTPHATDDAVRSAMAEYLDFAITKALDHRGLSAGRSVDHFRAFAWLLGDEEVARLEAAPYENYGVPQLHVAAEICGAPWPDDPALARMAEGLPCRDGCEEGCGS